MNHAELCRLIPHQGAMCLLDSVSDWSEGEIRCRAISQADPKNPLRHGDKLAAIHGVEYAAQAMAVHGALLDSKEAGPKVAYLAALRGVEFHCETLQQEPVLTLRCQRLGGDDNGFIYAFEVRGGESLLLEGRATVIKKKEGESNI